jgi:iron complex outermembrane receptor protein
MAVADETLQEVIITATPLRTTTLETAQPVLLLSADLLRRSLATNLGDTLANQPGLSSTSFGPIASRPVIRGQGGLRVQVYQDGAETLDVAALSDDHAVSIDPAFADRIEVLHGPAALMYGSASAAGAVNVVTDRLPLRNTDGPIETRLELRGDSANDERAVALRSGGHLGSGWQWRVDGFSKRSGDLSIADFVESPALRAELAAEGETVGDERGELHNTDAKSEGGSLGLGWSGDSLAVALSLSGYRNDYGLPEGGHAHGEHTDELDGLDANHADHEDVRIDLEQHRVDLAGEWRPTAGWIERWSLRLARNDYEHAEIEDSIPATRYGQLGYETRLTADRRSDDVGRGVLGLQYRDLDFAALGDEAFLPPSRTRSLGLFFFEERRFGALLVEAGARWERQTLDAHDAASSRYRDDAVSASIGSVWTSSPQTRWSLQLTRTQRHPTATELYADGAHLALQRYELGNADLGVETARTVDLAWRHNDADDRWQSKISLFVSDYRDYIFAAPLGLDDDHAEHAHEHDHDHGEALREVEYRATDARFHGLEAEWSIRELAKVAQGGLGLRLFGDLVRARDADGHALPQIPPLRIGGELNWSRGPWRVGLESLWHDAQTRLADNELRTDGYNLLAADIAYRHTYRHGAGAATMLWFLRGQNLLDEDARRHASPLKDVAPLAGRAVSAGVRVEF